MAKERQTERRRLEDEQKRNARKEVFSWVRMFVTVIVVVFVLTHFIIINAKVPSGSMENTITVMGSIYLLFAQQYAQAKDVAISAVWGLVMGTVTASGIPEAIAAAVLVLAIGKVLIQVLKRMNFSFIDAQTAK